MARGVLHSAALSCTATAAAVAAAPPAPAACAPAHPPALPRPPCGPTPAPRRPASCSASLAAAVASAVLTGGRQEGRGRDALSAGAGAGEEASGQAAVAHGAVAARTLTKLARSPPVCGSKAGCGRSRRGERAEGAVEACKCREGTKAGVHGAARWEWVLVGVTPPLLTAAPSCPAVSFAHHGYKSNGEEEGGAGVLAGRCQLDLSWTNKTAQKGEELNPVASIPR